MDKLKGRNVVVTGAASGLGLATARLFADEGAKVLLVDKSPLEEIAAERPDQFSAISADISSVRDLEAVRDHATSLYGQIDGVVACAGIGPGIPFADVTEEMFDRVVGINLKGTFFTIQTLLPTLRDGASIVIISSLVGASVSFPNFSVYGATKAALSHLTRSLASELRGRKIRVNSVAPGAIDTNILINAGASKAEYAEFLSTATQMSPVGRVGTAQDIAVANLYLVSDDSSFVNGTGLIIDGGFSLGPA